jgi:hypothetical protein
VKKVHRKSPFDKWVGYLKARERGKTDTIVKELRGN